MQTLRKSFTKITAGIIGFTLPMCVVTAIMSEAAESTPPRPTTKGQKVKSRTSESKPSATVTFIEAVHFTDPAGQDVVVEPGTYRVAVKGTTIQLVSADGTKLLISANAGKARNPLALTVPVGNEEHHLLVLLPNGKAVEAIGSSSGVQRRALSGIKELIAVTHGKVERGQDDLPPPPPPTPPPQRSAPIQR